MNNFQTEISAIQKEVQNFNSNWKNIQQLNENKTISSQFISENIFKFMTDIAKINNVFFNTVKLNQKVHSSIIQCQTNINNDTNNFMASTSILQKKFEQTLKQTKGLYQETIHQNQKARFLLEQFLNPIREQLKSKVDQTTFSLQMKMILDEYDQIGHKITYDNQQQMRLKQQKKKTISSQTLLFLKNQILPIISNIQHQVLKNTDDLLKNSQTLEQLKSKSSYFDSQIKKCENQIEIVQNRILRQINNKLGDSNLQKKFKQFSNRFIEESLQSFMNDIKKIEKQIKNSGSQIQISIQYIKNTNDSLIQKNKKMQNQLNNVQKKLLSASQKTETKFNQIDRILQNIKAQFLTNGPLQLSQKIANLQIKMKNVNQISESLKQSLLKDVGSNIIGRVNYLQKQNKVFGQHFKNFQSKFQIQNGEISCMRDILSKKANFSDILLHIQNKVDKQEFKNFKSNFMERSDSAQLKQKQITFKQTNITESLSRKNSSLNKRSFFSPSPIQKQDLENEQTKRFKLGYTSEFKDRKYWKTYNLRANLNRTNIFTNEIKQ